MVTALADGQAKAAAAAAAVTVVAAAAAAATTATATGVTKDDTTDTSDHRTEVIRTKAVHTFQGHAEHGTQHTGILKHFQTPCVCVSYVYQGRTPSYVIMNIYLQYRKQI